MGRRWAICFSGRIPSWDESARCLSNSFRNCCLGCIGAYSTQVHGHYHQPYKEIMRSLLAWMQCISSSLLPSRAVVVSPGIPPKHWNILTSSRSWPSGPPFSRARAGRQHHRTAELSVFARPVFCVEKIWKSSPPTLPDSGRWAESWAARCWDLRIHHGPLSWTTLA